MASSALENTISQKRSSALKVWLRAVRPESFSVSVVPVLLGVSIAWEDGFRINLLLAVTTILGAVAIHAAVNLLQDYFDYKSGLDREGTRGGSGVLVQKELTPSDILTASIIFFAVSAGLAVILILYADFLLIWLVAVGLVLGAGYAVPRYGLKYLMLGDVAVFAAFGIGITMGSYLVQTGRFDWHPFLCAVPFGLFVVAVLHANNMRDMITDLEVGHKNPAYRMGVKGSLVYYCFLIFGAYALTAAAIFAGFLHRGVLLILITFPLTLRLAKDVIGSNRLDDDVLDSAVNRTAKLALYFGLTMIAGIVVENLIA